MLCVSRPSLVSALAGALVPLLLLAEVTPAEAQRAGGATSQPPAFKGIFEPVPYGADVSLLDVFFVTPEVGWAAGGNGMTNGVIIATTDGGATWTVQVGDPESSERPYFDLRFVDGRTGFATQRASSAQQQLLRTTDGENWTVVGTVPDHRTDYTFVSATVGFVSYNESIRRTTDAGRTWTEVLNCRLKVQVNGLTRDARCRMEAFHFLSPRLGYAMGYSPDAPGVFHAKTEDGGETWSTWVTTPDEARTRELTFFYTDERHGTVCLPSGKFMNTEDGGQTWTATPGPACEGRPQVRFADPEVGWTLRFAHLNYTTNGGRRWTGRQVTFPAAVTAFTLPRRDRGYVVGDHGMVYRYRVVPAAQALKPNEIAAPAMPGMTGELEQQVSALDALLTELTQAVAAAPDSVAPGAVGAAATTMVEPAGEPAADPLSDPYAGGQIPDALPIPPADLPAASPWTAACCGKPQSRSKVIFGAIVAALPPMLERYRNTNTLGGTLLMLVELPLKTGELRRALSAFWKAPDKAAAQEALTQVASAAGALKTTTAMAFQRTPVQAAWVNPGSRPDDASRQSSTDARLAPSDAAKRAIEAAKPRLGSLIKRKIIPPT